MSDTPRTDRLMLEINEGRTISTIGPLQEHAENLERELAVAVKRAERFRDERNSEFDRAERHRVQKFDLRQELADERQKAKRERSMSYNLGVAAERKRCISAVSPQEMMRLMVSYGLIQEAAITDPEGYDEWKTTSAIIEMAEYIIARINAPHGGEEGK